MNIAIIGTRGIPNYYGGFEQFAEYLAKGLVDRGHDVTVYNSLTHPYQQSSWHGVKIIHCKDPEDSIGTIGQFIYDFNCIMHSRDQSFEIILQLGYTSSSIWGWLLPKQSIITTNMDGLEWMRSKYSLPVRWYLKLAEYLGIVFSDHLIADSTGIQEYLYRKYGSTTTYIPYGSEVFQNPNIEALSSLNLTPSGYNMLIARLEPENNIETILDGISQNLDDTFLVIGNFNTTYGLHLKEKYAKYTKIFFLGSIYDIEYLNNLRYFSNLYFHGHSVGGTNPSLLEAMGSNALICAHDNPFNKAILGDDAFYFKTPQDIYSLTYKRKEYFVSFLERNREKIINTYSWENIIDQYEEHFYKICKK